MMRSVLKPCPRRVLDRHCPSPGRLRSTAVQDGRKTHGRWRYDARVRTVVYNPMNPVRLVGSDLHVHADHLSPWARR